MKISIQNRAPMIKNNQDHEMREQKKLARLRETLEPYGFLPIIALSTLALLSPSDSLRLSVLRRVAADTTEERLPKPPEDFLGGGGAAGCWGVLPPPPPPASLELPGSSASPTLG